MQRAICFDVTHALSRLNIKAPTGIDNVDLRFLEHYANAQRGPGILFGWRGPIVLRPSRIREIAELAAQKPWRSQQSSTDLSVILAALHERPAPPVAHGGGKPLTPFSLDAIRAKWALARRQRHLRLLRDLSEVPEDAVYLNAAQHMLEHPRGFAWLKERRDVRAVMFVHDLLPLDYPEMFDAVEPALFERRLSTMLARAQAFVTSSEAVRDRLETEIRRRHGRVVPIHVEPMASMLAESREASCEARDAELSAAPYFVILGTIEPRKNHLLLLNIWRSLASTGRPTPKLIIVGARGWGNAQVFDVLDRARATRGHIIEARTLASPALLKLLVNARALLMPSFDEGYGLPMVEALSVGTPVIASDRPVFREVTQGCATYIDPIDGAGWRAAILDFSMTPSARRDVALRQARRFRPPAWPRYFERIDEFLYSL